MASAGCGSGLEPGIARANRTPWAAIEEATHNNPSQDRDLRGNPHGNRAFGWGEERLRGNGEGVSLGVIVERLRSQTRIS